MAIVMKASELVAKLLDIANNYKTLYVMGCFGAPMTTANKKYYCNNHEYNKKASRTNMIMSADKDTFGFDCNNLIKAILWGWNGDESKSRGGAKYKSNGVPDINADSMIKVCGDVSTDFSTIRVGEAVWCKGHIGVYIGDGLAVECTPAWKNKVQITAVKNIGTKSGYNARTWTKHGYLPWIEYDVTEKPKKPAAKKTVKATGRPKSKDNALSGTYKTTSDLHMRDDANTKAKSLLVLPKGTEVNNYGYYTLNGTTKWLWIQTVINGVTYTGFSSSKYLKKQ